MDMTGSGEILRGESNILMRAEVPIKDEYCLETDHCLPGNSQVSISPIEIICWRIDIFV